MLTKNHSIFSKSVIKSLSIIILVKNHDLSLALDNHCQITEHSIEQLNQPSLQLWACWLHSNVSFYKQHWAFACSSKQSAHFLCLQIFIVLFLFLRTLTWSTFMCQNSDQIWHYELLFCFISCFVEKFLHFIHCNCRCLNKTIIDEFLVNLVKIISENSSNLINQQFSKLLRMIEFWSIHDKDWSSFKLE